MKTRTRKPNPAIQRPDWCHCRCDKIRIDSEDSNPKKLVLSGDKASLTITEAPEAPSYWIIAWQISWSSVGEGVSGNLWMSKENLKAAFGLKCGFCPEIGTKLAAKFGAEAAFPGQFIRQGWFLNIPCPGTGDDGDPNISIKLSDEIVAAVSNLIGD